jgi:hypothetical protein
LIVTLLRLGHLELVKQTLWWQRVVLSTKVRVWKLLVLKLPLIVLALLAGMLCWRV